MRRIIHNMLVMSIACANQPEPSTKEPADLYGQFMAYRRLGLYIQTGKV